MSDHKIEWPDGERHEWKCEQWYRKIDNGVTTWIFSGRLRFQDFDVEVKDTGKRFRWEVGFDGVAGDAGYSNTLSVAMGKAVEVYNELSEIDEPKGKVIDGT
jgi:hypothetical protein